MKYSKEMHDWIRENKSVIVKVMGEADNPGVFHAYSLAEISHILLDEIERLREQTIDYENDIFLGQPIEYWMRIKAQLDDDNSDHLVREIILLKSELARRDEQISTLVETVARLKEDGERLASESIGYSYDGMDCECVHCKAYNPAREEVVHLPDCPITLHRALMKELEG